MFRHRDQSSSRSLIRNDKPQQTRVESLDIYIVRVSRQRSGPFPYLSRIGRTKRHPPDPALVLPVLLHPASPPTFGVMHAGTLVSCLISSGLENMPGSRRDHRTTRKTSKNLLRFGVTKFVKAKSLFSFAHPKPSSTINQDSELALCCPSLCS